ncbi:MAG: [FeFe] hydrogenase H-cluster maturation GTPase HydF [Megasphaera massiliensis]|uniref:[FeFe] hydrogenase H-cluster maturation GTPase HydF n=1 Tax=Megasphaera massiliensis TaxID=1232428 RepID=UPI00210E8CA9|nr:[FeFe] hydrogenase H-cluster maturation GTPase HydF [Megasphaera massiliensis]MCQ5211229.1 [FeFe] hydrogenase H-cluster maturation GTPase HydF [Megasphaera massiliensis]MEE0657540.1 [FeFe] hydrogenase H-cluster maturation GTPase HydF [Megasphaera massiliensis]
MGMNDTPSGERVHIGFFGRRNAGKSSVVNAVTGQNLSIVSDTKGTTTDPVYKAMELLPLGPVVIIDTPGIDDVGALGEERVRRTKQVLNKTDIAVVIVDGTEGLAPADEEVLALIRSKGLPYLIVYNKADLVKHVAEADDHAIHVSALTGDGIYELKEKLARLKPADAEAPIVSDLIHSGDMVVLVVPIDSAAPKGRLILPQQQTIREILDSNSAAIVVKEDELPHTLSCFTKKPSLVITDSQVFGRVSADTPDDIRLTSFSILMARHKGLLESAVRGVTAVDKLKDGDTVLIAEGCTHHRQCDDIGTVKIPRWLKEYTGKDISIETASGRDFPEDLSPYAMVIHCGGCMLNGREVGYRMKTAVDQAVPITNYGIAIAYMKGILRRSLSVFPDLQELLSAH